MIYYILGFLGLGTAGFVFWFLVNTGKILQQRDEFAKNILDLQFQGIQKNDYIKDVERISNKSKSTKEKIHAAFRRGTTAGELAELLNENFSKNTKTIKTSST